MKVRKTGSVINFRPLLLFPVVSGMEETVWQEEPLRGKLNDYDIPQSLLYTDSIGLMLPFPLTWLTMAKTRDELAVYRYSDESPILDCILVHRKALAD